MVLEFKIKYINYIQKNNNLKFIILLNFIGYNLINN